MWMHKAGKRAYIPDSESNVILTISEGKSLGQDCATCDSSFLWEQDFSAVYEASSRMAVDISY